MSIHNKKRSLKKYFRKFGKPVLTVIAIALTFSLLSSLASNAMAAAIVRDVEITVFEKLSAEQMREFDPDQTDAVILSDRGVSYRVDMANFYAMQEGATYCVSVIGEGDPYIWTSYGIGRCAADHPDLPEGPTTLTVAGKYQSATEVLGAIPERMAIIDQYGRGFVIDAILFAGLDPGQTYCLEIARDFMYQPARVVQNLGTGECMP